MLKQDLNWRKIDMKVILLQDVKGLGKKNAQINVSDGYAKNFLFPRKLAVPETQKSLEILANQQENLRIQDEKNRQDALELKEKLKDITLEFEMKSGKDGKMFGSISLKQVEEEMLKVHNIKIDKRKFIDKGPIDIFGIMRLRIELYKGVEGIVNVHVKEQNK